MRTLWIFLLAAALAGCASAPTRNAAGVQRLYVFNCGESTVADVSRWTKVAAIMTKTGAELWIDHDKAQSDKIPKSPAYIE